MLVEPIVALDINFFFFFAIPTHKQFLYEQVICSIVNTILQITNVQNVD